MLTVFDWLESMAAVRALELKGSKGLATDFAFELSATTSIIVDVFMRGPAKRTYGIFRNGANLTLLGFDRFHSFAITESVVLVPELPVLFDKRFDDRKL